MFSNEFKLLAGLAALCYFTLFIITPNCCCVGDTYCWALWSENALQYGLGGMYKGDTNYCPLFLYIIKFFAVVTGTPERINTYIRYLRDIFLIFDIAGVVMAAWVFKKNNVNPLYALFILLNIAYLYNTVVWAQADSIHTALIAAALVLGLNKKAVLACACFLLAYNIKLQAVIFLPLLLLLVLPQFIENWKKIIWAVLVLMGIECMILLPFMLHGEAHSALTVYRRQLDFYPVISMNAFNIWHLIFPRADLMVKHDADKFLAFSFKQWGLGAFMLSSFFALLPAFLRFIGKRALTVGSKEDYKLIFLSAAMITLNFFYFNTQMHERYSHPVILFAAIYCILEGRYLFYILVSCAYLLNMEEVLRHLDLPNYHIFPLSPFIVAIIFGTAIIFGYCSLYKARPLRGDLKNFLHNLRKGNISALPV